MSLRENIDRFVRSLGGLVQGRASEEVHGEQAAIQRLQSMVERGIVDEFFMHKGAHEVLHVGHAGAGVFTCLHQSKDGRLFILAGNVSESRVLAVIRAFHSSGSILDLEAWDEV